VDLAEQIQKRHGLHESGVLSDAEFARAKESLLEPSRPVEVHSMPGKRLRPYPETGSSLGRAANRFVSLQIVMGVIGVILFLIFLFAVFLPAMHGMPGGMRF
jgi:hypothetical protein